VSVLDAAAELAEARGRPRPRATVSGEHVAASFGSERHLRLDGAPAGAGFAPLSRVVRCADGWARTHGNYPHHAAALRRALALGAGAGVAELDLAAARWRATELEARVVEAGGCAAALRSGAAWGAHPAGRAAGAEPLIGWRPAGPAVPPRRLPALADGARPAAGVRVLDLTRVIAGPVAGRTLAALGASVLRVDPPAPPELPAQHLDTGPGKRTAALDLAADPAARERLLAGADVVLLGYRAGALARLELDETGLSARHPGLVQVRLSAWGHTGPWAGRRGFDSLVQVASGIAERLAGPDGRPGALPVQALDHATGHLMAAAALHGLVRRERGEPPAPARLSLARTAAELLARPASAPAAPRALEVDRFRVSFGRLSLIGPPGELDGRPLGWGHGPRPLGGDPPAWPPR
jgi:hypothetical protein